MYGGGGEGSLGGLGHLSSCGVVRELGNFGLCLVGGGGQLGFLVSYILGGAGPSQDIHGGGGEATLV